MKKTVGLFILASIAVVLVSCKEKSCRYADMEYNTVTKQCDCIQYLDSGNAPKLKKDDYNSVLAVNQNFYYASVDHITDYPYYSHEGDTIMFYGNVDRMDFSYPDSTWVRLTIADASGFSGVGSRLYAECMRPQLEEVDLLNRCYLTGVLTFDGSHEHVDIPISDPEADMSPCASRGFMFDIIDIHN